MLREAPEITPHFDIYAGMYVLIPLCASVLLLILPTSVSGLPYREPLN
jgi:hypothetical protein